MDNTLQTIEDSFAAIPPEVQQYIYSDEFEQKLSDLCIATTITAEKQEQVRGAIFNFIAQIDTEEDLEEAILGATENEADRKKIREWININISQKILFLITQAYIADAEETDAEAEAQHIIPTPSDAPATPVSPLSKLADSLKQVSSHTVTRRTYGDEQGTAPDNLPISEPGTGTESQSPIIKTIDPYHEPIEK